MARPLRIAYPGAFYHVLNRGLEQRVVFRDGGDYASFLEVIELLHPSFGFRVHSYCLMPTHYHLFLETPQGNLSRVMQQLNSRYTQRFNRRHGRNGPLFQGRYRALLVDKHTYALAVTRYIHLNPVTARLVRRPEEYPWSSYGAILGRRAPAPFQEIQWLLGQCARNRREARRAFHRFTVAGSQEPRDPFATAEGGTLLGSDDFRHWVKRRLLPRKRDSAIARLRQLQKPQDVGAIGKAVSSLTADSRLRRKLLVYALRKFTPLTLREVGQRVGGMKPVAVSQLVRRLDDQGGQPGALGPLLRRLGKMIMSHVKL
jgi:REP element-mobilizing transposase RayT